MLTGFCYFPYNAVAVAHTSRAIVDVVVHVGREVAHVHAHVAHVLLLAGMTMTMASSNTCQAEYQVTRFTEHQLLIGIRIRLEIFYDKIRMN